MRPEPVWKKKYLFHLPQFEPTQLCTQVTICDDVVNSGNTTPDGKKCGLERVWRNRLVT